MSHYAELGKEQELVTDSRAAPRNSSWNFYLSPSAFAFTVIMFQNNFYVDLPLPNINVTSLAQIQNKLSV